MFTVLAKTMRDKRFFILGWSLGLAFLGFLMTAFFTSFNGNEIDELFGALPPAMQGLVGDLQDWKELPTYIGSQIFDIRLPIFISILAILLAVSLTVGEEDKGQLRTLTSLPVSRRSIIISKWLAIAVICFVASLATVAGIVLGLPLTGETLDYMVLVRLGLMTWLLVTALATVIFAVGLSTGKRGLTTAVAIIVTIGSFLLSSFAGAVDWLKDYEWLSMFNYFPAVDIAKGVTDWWDVAVYGLVIAVSLVVTFIAFPRRDIHAG